MRLSRIRKYSKQIVSQDMVISCNVENVKEIPSIKRGAITSFSYKDQKTGMQSVDRKAESSFSANSLSLRNIHLCGLLMCWHLLNQRGAPTSLEGQDSYHTQKKGKLSATKSPCKFKVSLRRREIETALEKWLFFILPRTFEKVAKKEKNLFSDIRDNTTGSSAYIQGTSSFLPSPHGDRRTDFVKSYKEKQLCNVNGVNMDASTVYATYLRRDFMSVRSIYFHTALSLPFSNTVSLDRYKNLYVPAHLSGLHTSVYALQSKRGYPSTCIPKGTPLTSKECTKTSSFCPIFTCNKERFVTDHYLYAHNAQPFCTCKNMNTQHTNTSNSRVSSWNKVTLHSSIPKEAPVHGSADASLRDLSTVLQNQLSISNGADKNNVQILSRKSVCNCVSLHCANVLLVPEMQDLAQSGILVLEGSLSLQLSLR